MALSVVVIKLVVKVHVYQLVKATFVVTLHYFQVMNTEFLGQTTIVSIVIHKTVGTIVV